MNTTSIDLGDTTLLCIFVWTLCKRSRIFGTKKIESVKHKWYERMLIILTCFLMFCHFAWSSFEGRLSHIKNFNPQSNKRVTSIKSAQACFPPTHSHTRTSNGLGVGLPSRGSIKKFTCDSFFTDIHLCINISKRTSPTKSCMPIFEVEISLQWIVCSLKVYRHTLRKTCLKLDLKVN